MNESAPAPLVPVVLDAGRCIDCGRCLDACPTGVFQRPEPQHKPEAVFAQDCHVCFLCVPDCPTEAISVTWEAPNPRQHSVYDVLGMDFQALHDERGNAALSLGDTP